MRACVYIYMYERDIVKPIVFLSKRFDLVAGRTMRYRNTSLLLLQDDKVKNEYVRGVYLTPPSVLETLKARDFSSHHLLCF